MGKSGNFGGVYLSETQTQVNNRFSYTKDPEKFNIKAVTDKQKKIKKKKLKAQRKARKNNRK